MRIILKADKGKIYTDGTIYGTTIFLEEGKSADNFRQITKEEYNALMEAENENLEIV